MERPPGHCIPAGMAADARRSRRHGPPLHLRPFALRLRFRPARWIRRRRPAHTAPPGSDRRWIELRRGPQPRRTGVLLRHRLARSEEDDDGHFALRRWKVEHARALALLDGTARRRPIRDAGRASPPFRDRPRRRQLRYLDRRPGGHRVGASSSARGRQHGRGRGVRDTGGVGDLVFARSPRTGGRPRPVLFITTGGKDPVALPAVVNDANTNSNPLIAADGSFLVFASDRPGGQGDTDLWVSFRGPEGWSEPRNLGPPIDTAEGEFAPGLSADGRLLFFTRRHGGENLIHVVRAPRLLQAP